MSSCKWLTQDHPIELQALRRKANADEVKMVVNHNFPSENEVEAEDNETLRELGGAMSTHHKVSTWYAEVTASDDFYRSNVVFLEVSLQY
jgi:hypothetical protein